MARIYPYSLKAREKVFSVYWTRPPTWGDSNRLSHVECQAKSVIYCATCYISLKIMGRDRILHSNPPPFLFSFGHHLTCKIRYPVISCSILALSLVLILRSLRRFSDQHQINIELNLYFICCRMWWFRWSLSHAERGPNKVDTPDLELVNQPSFDAYAHVGSLVGSYFFRLMV